MFPDGRSIRFVWILAFLGLAAFAVIYELDRAARQNSRYASLVPSEFGSFSLAQKVLKDASAAQGGGAGALEQARLLVLRRPVPAEHLSLLALVAYKSGDAQLSSAAVNMAASRGWRDPIAQVSIFEAAAAAGEWQIAAQRLDALRRTNQPSAVTDGPLRTISADPAGRSALAQQLASEAGWRDYFLRQGREILPAEQFTDVVVRVNHAGVPFDCAELAEALRRMLRSGKRAEVQAAWTGPCERRYGGAAHAAFNPEASSGMSPFYWSYPEQTGISLSVEKDSVLSYSNADAFKRVIAQRFFFLNTGNYGVKLDRRGAGAGVNADVQVYCTRLDEPGRGVRLRANLEDIITVPQECPVQIVEIRAGMGQGSLQDVEFIPMK